ncbi:MAG: hypothetical protein RIC87_10750 [Kiloniellales bacterium]
MREQQNGQSGRQAGQRARSRVSKGRYHDVDEVRAWAMAREQRAAFFKARALRKLWVLQQQQVNSARAPRLTGAQAYTAV